ncbi:ABC transporter permease subunit [bacterium]|nr:MAG: ABC transporter permease subunit [bacterium]
MVSRVALGSAGPSDREGLGAGADRAGVRLRHRTRSRCGTKPDQAVARRLATTPRGLTVVFSAAGGAALLFVVLPLVQLYALQDPAALLHAAGDAAVRASVALSLEAALVTALLAGAVGVPLGYLLARRAFRGRSLIEGIVDVPLAVPHTVVGIALLLVFGRTGIIGAPVEAATGLRFWGTAAGVVVAMLYVSLPYAVDTARQAFAAMDPELELVSRTLGAGAWRTFARVTLPLCWRSIVAGMTMSGARALSEFGAIVILAYYPMTAPVKIYDLFLQGGLRDSAAAAVLFLTVTLAIFVGLRLLVNRREAVE